MKKIFYLLVIISWQAWSQNEVAITIDDVPNVHIYKQDGYKSRLLEQIKSLKIPVTVFINEKNIYSNTSEKENIRLLELWLKDKNVTAGNHSYSHINYADTTLEAFKYDIIRGEKLTKEMLKKRPLYFRFPFNSLGNDSLAHGSIRQVLADLGYVHTPFTVESEDWAYNALYEKALKDNDVARARAIGEQYVLQTLKLFQHFEAVSQKMYGRNIKHIYLCHDNTLNTDYLAKLVDGLKKGNYRFISLEQALKDPAYKSKEYYTGRYGFSWLYRWERDVNKRKSLMHEEPIDEQFRADYEKLVSQE